MIYVAFYDPASGSIIQCSSGDRPSLEADGRPFVELVTRPPLGFDRTHRIVAGQPVPIA